ncbi:unnamed protein product, partial [Prorocentrum cordatum]
TPRSESAEPDPEYVLVAIYQEAEALRTSPSAPLQGGDRRSELLALNKELLNNALMQFPGACERYSARQREVQVQLWEACISSELQRMRSPVHGTKARRMKSKILIGGEASEVARLNPEVFSYMRLDELKFEQVFATRTLDPESGAKVTDNETESDVLRRYIVPPHHSRKVKWDLFVGALVLYSVMVIPFRFGFGIQDDGFSEAIDCTVDFLFFVDICLSFRTGYLDSEGGVNTIPSHIRNRYLRGWFVIDLISTLPWAAIVSASVPEAKQNTAASRLLRFTRLTRMLKMARVIKIARLSKLAVSSVGPHASGGDAQRAGRWRRALAGAAGVLLAGAWAARRTPAPGAGRLRHAAEVSGQGRGGGPGGYWPRTSLHDMQFEPVQRVRFTNASHLASVAVPQGLSQCHEQQHHRQDAQHIDALSMFEHSGNRDEQRLSVAPLLGPPCNHVPGFCDTLLRHVATGTDDGPEMKRRRLWPD